MEEDLTVSCDKPLQNNGNYVSPGTMAVTMLGQLCAETILKIASTNWGEDTIFLPKVIG